MPINKGTITKKLSLTDDVLDLEIKTDTPFQFKAGQYISIKVCDDQKTPCFRPYSISSSPHQTDTLNLCLKVIPNGRATTWLNTLEPNTHIEFLGPIGNFLFTPSQKTTLFIATGTGIAPFKSMIEDELAKGNKQNFHLIFGVRHIKDIFYKEFFETLATKHSNFKFTLTLSQPEGQHEAKTGRVTDFLQTLDIVPENTSAYICGLKAMITDVTAILEKKGIPKTEIHFEKYD